MAAKNAIRTLYTRMGFSAAAAQSMLDEQGLTSLDDIKVLTDQRVEALCKVIRRPGGRDANAAPGVWLAFLLAGANSMEVCMSDIGNAYVHAKTHKSVFAIATAPFGEDEGCIAIIVKALYGLKTSGAAWHALLPDTLSGMGCTLCRADTDVWMKRRAKPTGDNYWEYHLVYTDDILCVSHDARDVMVKLEQMFKLKGGIGEPTTYLGATIGKHKVQGTGQEFWCMSSTAYLKEVIRNIEQKGGKLTSKDVTTPTAAYFHPELDESEFLNNDNHTYYQSLIAWCFTVAK
jgi:hypothetical protein